MSKKVLSDLDFTSVARITGATGFAGTATTGAATLTASAASLTLTATGASSDLVCSAGRNVSASATGTAAVTGGTGVTVTATTGNLALTATAAALNCTAGSSINLTHASGSFVSITGTSGSFLKFVNEAAASTPSMSAGQALYWVKDNTPNDPFFTDDTNTDRKLATAPVPNADLAVMAAATVNGRALGAGSGVRTDLTPIQVAAIAAAAGKLEKELFADFSVNVPAVLIGALGFVNVSTVGTALAPLAIDDNVSVLPRADAPPCSYRVSAADTVRLGYQGTISAIASAPYRIFKRPSGFLPSDLSTANGGPLSGWLRVVNATSDVNGISSVPDMLNSNPAVQASNTLKPALELSANSRPCMRFAGLAALQWPLVTAVNNGASQTGFCFWFKADSLASFPTFLAIDNKPGGSTGFKLDIYQMSGQIRLDTPGTIHSDTPAAGFSALTWVMFTLELNMLGATMADRVVMTINAVPVAITFSGSFTTLTAPTGNLIFGNNSSTTGGPDKPYLGLFGPNIYSFSSKMAAATEGLLTQRARLDLMSYEPPT